VKVVETSDFGCVGDTITLNVFYDNPSLYLRYLTVNPPPADDNGVEVYWKLQNAPRYNNQLIIQRRRAGSGELFADVGTVNGSVVKFNHTNTNNDVNAWDYRVKGYDLCGKEIYTDVHTSILLTGTKTDAYSVSMNFTPYLGWGSTSIRYDIYRQLKNSTDFELYEANVTDFNAAFSNGLEYYTQCYRVKATKLGTDTVSWSNDICFNFDPTLFIPTAFSPNTDDVNDGYFVKGGALKTFDFKIYNRWGEKLFQTEDLKFVWDGKYKGEDQPQDVYMYYCYYTGFDGKKYSTKGTITLLR
jgi:gliding motility-associated-like protein